METDTQNTVPPPNTYSDKPKGRLYVRWYVLVIALLILAIGVCIFLWKPWQPAANARTVTVSGDATITADPDEYTFSPSYDFSNPDKATALAAMAKKSDEVVVGLKALGVADSKIKTNSNGYNEGSYYPATDSGVYKYYLNLTVITNDKTLTQKVQDYLLNSGPTGSVSPYAGFSKDKEKQLESQARDKAEKDAHDKAAQSAKNLGFKIGAVKTISDGSFGGYGGCGPSGLCNGANVEDSLQSGSATKLTVQPGQNDLDYTVSVTYYIH